MRTPCQVYVSFLSECKFSTRHVVSDSTIGPHEEVLVLRIKLQKDLCESSFGCKRDSWWTKLLELARGLQAM